MGDFADRTFARCPDALCGGVRCAVRRVAGRGGYGEVLYHNTGVTDGRRTRVGEGIGLQLECVAKSGRGDNARRTAWRSESCRLGLAVDRVCVGGGRELALGPIVGLLGFYPAHSDPVFEAGFRSRFPKPWA